MVRRALPGYRAWACGGLAKGVLRTGSYVSFVSSGSLLSWPRLYLTVSAGYVHYWDIGYVPASCCVGTAVSAAREGLWHAVPLPTT